MAGTKGKDEKVDGARIAADILSHMPSANKERILKEMSVRDPEILVKVQDNLLNFNDIASLTPQGMQVLIKSIEHNDLILSLKTASAEVKDAFFINMTERKAALVKEDFAALPKVKLSDVEEAQRRIMKKLEELRSSGQIRTQSKNDVWV